MSKNALFQCLYVVKHSQSFSKYIIVNTFHKQSHYSPEQIHNYFKTDITYYKKSDVISILNISGRKGSTIQITKYLKQINDYLLSTQDNFTPKDISDILYSLTNISVFTRNIEKLLSRLTNKLKTDCHDKPFTSNDIVRAFYGLKQIPSDNQGVDNLLQELILKISICSETFTAIGISNILYGLQSMNSDCEQVRQLLTALLPKIASKSVVFQSSESMANALYGLQNMSSEYFEVRQLLNVLITKINAPPSIITTTTSITPPSIVSTTSITTPTPTTKPNSVTTGFWKVSHIGYALYGLQNMSTKHEEVQQLLHLLLQNIPPYNPSTEAIELNAIGNALYGLHGKVLPTHLIQRVEGMLSTVLAQLTHDMDRITVAVAAAKAAKKNTSGRGKNSITSSNADRQAINTIKTNIVTYSSNNEDANDCDDIVGHNHNNNNNSNVVKNINNNHDKSIAIIAGDKNTLTTTKTTTTTTTATTITSATTVADMYKEVDVIGYVCLYQSLALTCPDNDDDDDSSSYSNSIHHTTTARSDSSDSSGRDCVDADSSNNNNNSSISNNNSNCSNNINNNRSSNSHNNSSNTNSSSNNTNNSNHSNSTTTTRMSITHQLSPSGQITLHQLKSTLLHLLLSRDSPLMRQFMKTSHHGSDAERVYTNRIIMNLKQQYPQEFKNKAARIERNVLLDGFECDLLFTLYGSRSSSSDSSDHHGNSSSSNNNNSSGDSSSSSNNSNSSNNNSNSSSSDDSSSTSKSSSNNNNSNNNNSSSNNNDSNNDSNIINNSSDSNHTSKSPHKKHHTHNPPPPHHHRNEIVLRVNYEIDGPHHRRYRSKTFSQLRDEYLHKRHCVKVIRHDIYTPVVSRY